MSSDPVADAPHVHHPAADHSVEFKGMAAFEAKGDVKPFAYNPSVLAPNFVEVKIECCGICGSDIHTIDSGWYKAKYPLIVGHEIVGTITAAGSEVKNVKVGDRVGIGAQCGSCLDGSAVDKCYECKAGKVQHCSVERTLTYGTQRPDGQVTQGGYADRIRCASTFTVPIPESISSVDAAPLMCAGITVYAPLSRFLTRPGMRVGVIGIGGLGHLALQFASQMQAGSAIVTAISHNSKKREESLKLGAHHFLDTSNGKEMWGAARSFDLILCTANGKSQDYNQWLGLCALDAVFCCVGLPETPLDIEAFSLLGSRVTLCASLIGTPAEIVQMLDFAASHNVRPIVERLPMEQAQAGINKVRDGSVRFRVVLENPVA